MVATEDRRLINRIRSGDKGAFEELVKRHYKDVFAYCYRRTGNREDAEDLTQEVFLKLVKAIYKYRHTGNFRNFIFTVAAWAVLAAVNLIMTTVSFGWEGAEAYWQDWLIKISPFCWNSGMALAAALATSLLGTVFFAALVMAISALFRAPAPAMLISFALLLIPSIDLGENAPAIVSAVNTCMPATIM